MEKYHNSGNYNDLCEYKRVLNRATSEYKGVLNRATSEYKRDKYSFEKIASNVKTNPKSFYA